MAYEYIRRFEGLGMGLFVHFGLYSVLGKGEWYLTSNPHADAEAYARLPEKFKVRKGWAQALARVAKRAGAKYITLTTRHHDGFSLYDTCGLNTFDAPHSAAGRDLIAEFVAACREAGLVPFFYHTLLDWHEQSYKTDFKAYIDYLAASLEILCTRYGKIGGFWFDGMWDKPGADWQESRLYALIRKYQPEAMIVNNTGLNALGETGHHEIDSVTFERGRPAAVRVKDKPIAGEMCQVLNDHWGYAKNDVNYKPVSTFLGDLVDCRRYNCNYLLNTGLRGDGSVNPTDKCLLGEVGKWIRANKNFIYGVRGSDCACEGGFVLEDEKAWYIVVKDVVMAADPNVQRRLAEQQVRVDARVAGKAYWLDSGEKAQLQGGELAVQPYDYGTSYAVRVAKVEKGA